MSKYVIKNCPVNYGLYKEMCGICEKPEDVGVRCADCTDCVLKQIVESCKKTVKIFSAESGTHPYAGGRCAEAEGILQLLDIQEVE